MSKTVVFITALSVEFLAVKSFIQNWKEAEHDEGTIYQESNFAGWRIGLAKTGKGNSNAAMETERAIQFFNPEYVFFVGVAGGIKDVKLGDIVIAETMKGYEKGKEVGNVFLPRSEVGKSSYKLVKRADTIADNSDWNQKLNTGIKPKALIGVIAAGEKVVASEYSVTYKRLITLYSDALAVEMEGIGFLTAIHANSAKGIVIRGISDLLGNKTESDKSGWQEIAAHHAAAFAFAMLEKLSPISKNNDLQNLQEKINPNHSVTDSIQESLYQMCQSVFTSMQSQDKTISVSIPHGEVKAMTSANLIGTPIPIVDGSIPRKMLVLNVTQLLREQRIVFLYGSSGLGKTNLATLISNEIGGNWGWARVSETLCK